MSVEEVVMSGPVKNEDPVTSILVMAMIGLEQVEKALHTGREPLNERGIDAIREIRSLFDKIERYAA